MAKSRATPQKLTQAQQDALDALVSMKVPKPEAADLISRAQGADSGEILNHALRLRHAASQRVAPPQGAKLQSVGGAPVPPITPPQVPSAQQQIPGFGPPGGQGAAPTAQQLQESSQGSRTRPNWFWRLMGAYEPPQPGAWQRAPGGYLLGSPSSRAQQPQPAPIAQQPAPSAVAAPAPTAGGTTPQPMPAPVKPRIRVKAAGGKIPEAPRPTEVEQPKEAKQEGELPLVSSQEEYDKLPIGTRFKHPDGFIYRKERESGAQGPAQKLQQGGVVAQKPEQQPWEANWQATYGMPPEADATQSTDTDTVPAQLTPGEYVVPKPAVDKIGADKLDAMTAAAQSKEPATPATSAGENTAFETADAATLDKNLGGVLKGHAQTYIEMGKKYNVNPYLLAAISKAETGNGTSKMAKEKNNVAGLFDSKANEYRTFDNIDQSIEFQAKTLRNGYLSQGLTTIPQIAAKYAPVGAANDPNATNNQWPGMVAKFFHELGGGTVSAAAAPGGQGQGQGQDTTGKADFFRKRGDQPISAENDPRLADVNVGDQNWRVNREAAPYFRGFLSELQAAGAPVSSSGGWAYREKVGAKGISEHAFGGAIDVNQTGRNTVTPAFRKWIEANPGVLQQAEQRWHIYGGERFGDLGHFEWGGVT